LIAVVAFFYIYGHVNMGVVGHPKTLWPAALLLVRLGMSLGHDLA
jgi:hypothetical protein